MEFKHLKKKRPFWKEVVICGIYGIGLWGIIHGALNFSAYAQIIEYKFDKTKDKALAVKQNIASWTQANLIPNKLEPLEIYPDLKKKTKTRVRYDKDHFIYKGKKLEKRNQFKKVFRDMSVHPSDDRIYISRIDKNVPLVGVPNHKNFTVLENRIQEALRNGIAIHPFSRAPGQLGNFFVTGHSSYFKWDPGRFKDVLALLHEVKIGDEVEVYKDGKKFVYVIKEEKIVSPHQVDVLDHPFDRSILTLMTCTPVGTDTNRLIMVGELKGDPLKALSMK